MNPNNPNTPIVSPPIPQPDETDTDFESSTNTSEEINANKGKIFALGFYLLLMIFISVYFLGAMMTAETDKDIIAAKMGQTPTPTPAESPTPAETTTPTPTPTPTPTATPTPVGTPGNVNSSGGNNSTNGSVRPPANATATKTPTPTPTPTLIEQNFVKADIPNQVYVYIPVPFTPVSQIISANIYVFLIVIFSGMLGGAIRAIYSFVKHLGLKDFAFNWTWFYVSLPFTGAALSLLIYFVLRGGFYGSSVGEGLVFNPFSFAALAALTGLFTDSAMEKLKQVADTLLTKSPPKVANAKEIMDKKEEKKNK